MRLPSVALWHAFADGHRFVTKHGEVLTTRIEDAGPLVLPTGSIVAGDPILDPWNKPFTVKVPPDSYPVLVSLIRDEVALVMVHFAEGSPVRWQASRPRSFIVDSATGCLMDERVCRLLRRKAESGAYEKFVRRFDNALAENNGLWGKYCLDPDSGANVFLFRTWGGDGSFPSFFGYDSNGNVICLVIDMFLHLNLVTGSVPD